ncbi:hypothetical protein [Mucilaginibacter sp. SP1R1]|uniref:hypothetical protein n=1 Tax=Mucilaginibacter sp. SP1R1 TaxID=2723091 RepID=UPI003B00BEE8
MLTLDAKNVIIDPEVEGLQSLKIYLNDVDSLTVAGSVINLETNDAANAIKKAQRNILLISYLNNKTVRINSKQQQLLITNSKIKFLNIAAVIIYKKFEIRQTKIDSVNFDNTLLPDTIGFNNTDLRDLKGAIDLTHLKNTKICTIKLNNVDFTKFKLPLDRFEFIIDSSQGFEKRSIIYQQLLKQLSDAGLTQKFEKYDKEFTALKLLHEGHYFINFLSKNWWDYGYDKGMVIYNGIIIFLIYFVVNIFLYGNLRLVYSPGNFLKYDEKIRKKHRENSCKRRITRIPGVFLYTAYLFWGLNLDLSKLELKHFLTIALIVLEYVSGVVCIAYIANYVITK